MFALYAIRSRNQVQRAPGFLAGGVLSDRRWTFWTMTAWDNADSIRRYMTSGAHKQAMPKLMHWCDEASVAHWEQPDAVLPSWTEADRRMRAGGRPSKIDHPTEAHADLKYSAPRTTGAGTMLPEKRASG